MISQWLSTRLLVAGGVLLILAAVIPRVVHDYAFESPAEEESGRDESESATADQPAPSWPDIINPTLDPEAEPDEAQPPEANEKSRSRPANDFSPPPAGRDQTREAQPPFPAEANSDPTPREAAKQSPRPDRPVARLNRAMTLGAGGMSRDRVAERPAARPGVARFEGTIETPSGRTIHERAEPGVH